MRAPWEPDSSSSVVGGHAREVADDDLVGADASDVRWSGGHDGDRLGGDLGEECRERQRVVGLERERHVRAGEFEVRVAHGVDEHLALALVAQRDRGAGEQRQRGEQQVGGGESVSRPRARCTACRNARGAPRGGLERGAEHERVRAGAEAADLGERRAVGCQRREARSAAVERAEVRQEDRLQAELLDELAEPDGVAGGEVRAGEDGDAVGVERRGRVDVARESGERADRCSVALLEAAVVVGGVDRDDLRVVARRRAGERARRRRRP